MASNDGQRLTVFGLTFRQHDNRHMQQILRQYGRLPSNPGDRSALFSGLFDLTRELGEDERQGIEDWLQNGGEFPAPAPVFNYSLPEPDSRNTWGHEEEHDEWPDYNPADFESGSDREEDQDPFVPGAGTFHDENSHRGAADEHDNEQDSEAGENAMSGNDEVPIHTNTSTDHQVINSAQPPNSSTTEFECGICTEPFASSELLAPPQVTATCDHDHDWRVCFPCLQQAIESVLEEGALQRLICPFCPERLSHDNIKKYSTNEAFARYEYLLLLQTPDIVMCLNPHCTSGQIHQGNTPMMICNTCGFSTCVHHKLPWHTGLTCAEFDTSDEQVERLEQAEATAKLLSKDHSKICPNCKQGVTKQDGCDHLMCRCGKEWCFICLASWENIMRVGAEAHHPTCDYHPRKIRKLPSQIANNQAQLTETVLGEPASEALLRAREARNERVRAELRPKAAEAALKRMEEQREREKEEGGERKKRKVRLVPAWEER